MTSRIGFFVFLGAIIGAVGGNYLPFAPILETLAGIFVGAVLAILLDRRSAGQDQTSEE